MSNDPYEEHAWELIGMDEFEEPTHLESVQLKLKDLGAEELEMVDLIVDRILMGKEYYGEWRPSEDKRDNIQEAIEEALDGCNYLAAELLRIKYEL